VKKNQRHAPFPSIGYCRGIWRISERDAKNQSLNDLFERRKGNRNPGMGRGRLEESGARGKGLIGCALCSEEEPTAPKKGRHMGVGKEKDSKKKIIDAYNLNKSCEGGALLVGRVQGRGSVQGKEKRGSLFL